MCSNNVERSTEQRIPNKQTNNKSVSIPNDLNPVLYKFDTLFENLKLNDSNRCNIQCKKHRR